MNRHDRLPSFITPMSTAVEGHISLTFNAHVFLYRPLKMSIALTATTSVGVWIMTASYFLILLTFTAKNQIITANENMLSTRGIGFRLTVA